MSADDDHVLGRLVLLGVARRALKLEEREAVLAAVAAGISRQHIAECLGVSKASVVAWVQEWQLEDELYKS